MSEEIKPSSVDLEINVKTYTFKKIPLIGYVEILKLLKSLTGYFNADDDISIEAVLPKLPAMLSDNSNEVFRILAISTGARSQEEIDLRVQEIQEWSLDDVIKAITALGTVNDFSTTKKNIQELLKKWNFTLTAQTLAGENRQKTKTQKNGLKK